MNFDLNKTISLTKGGLLDRENTWRAYFENTPDWKETAIALTAPLLFTNVLLTLVFSRMAGGFVSFGYQQAFLPALLIGLFLAAVGVAVFALILNVLAGVFEGKPDISRAFAAITFAMIPGWLAGVVGALIPLIGFFVALAGGVLGLVFLYQILPLGLAIPQQKRAVHFVSAIVLGIIVQMMVRFLFMGNSMQQAVPG